MIQPTPVAAADPQIVLDQNFAENAMMEMRKLGAVNAAPPLARSPFLKNKTTGVILPWSPALAEQRDILVNCDAQGNEDPAAWRMPESAMPDASELMREAYASITQKPEPPAAFMQSVPPKGNQGADMPFDAKPLSAFENASAQVEAFPPVQEQSAVALDALSAAMD